MDTEQAAAPFSQESAIVPIAPDWNDIQARYLTGEELATIAQDHGVSVSNISVRAHREKWKAQQFKLLEKHREQIGQEVKDCLTVSVLKEARAFHRADPSSDPDEADTWSRVRLRLLDTASKLFAWDQDKAGVAKPAKCIDV